MANPFAKSRPASQPYAIYRVGSITMHVCKTYKTPRNEDASPFARWFVWAKSPMTYGDFEGGDTYARDVRREATLVAAEPAWLEAYAPGRNVPTPAEYLANA